MIKDRLQDFVAMIVNDSSDWMTSKLEYSGTLLGHMLPDLMETTDSTKPGYNFGTIYCDTFSRYAEKMGLIFMK